LERELKIKNLRILLEKKPYVPLTGPYPYFSKEGFKKVCVPDHTYLPTLLQW